MNRRPYRSPEELGREFDTEMLGRFDAPPTLEPGPEPAPAPKTVHVRELENDRMVGDNVKAYRKVVDQGYLMEWLGSGWYTHGKASPLDARRYPHVVRGDA